LLLEVTCGAGALTFEPIAVLLAAKPNLEVVNLDFDEASRERAFDKVRRRMTRAARPRGSAPEREPRSHVVDEVVRKTIEAALACVARSIGPDLDAAASRCEAVGLVALAEAVRAMRGRPCSAAALRTVYLAAEAQNALLFEE
jgi:hypothetical protein